MNTLTQKLCFRQSVVLYSQRNSVFSAIRKFEISRATIYRWRKMYDGTLDSLAERSRRPHNHPNQHTSKELKLISDMRRRNPEAGLVVFWVKLMQRGYNRSISSLWRVLKRLTLLPVNRLTQNILPNLTKKCFIPVKEFKLTLKSYLNLV